MIKTRATDVLYQGLTFAESPRWHDRAFWISDFHAGVVLRSDGESELESVVEVPGEPSGLGWLPDGRLLVASMQDRRVLRLDPEGLALHADLSSIATHHLNDMVVDGAGRAYVGNFGSAWDPERPATPAPIARVDPDGTVCAATDGLEFPNGSAISPDGATFFVAETRGGRISAFDLGPRGELSGRRIWAETDGAPDGICLDAEGALWVALPMLGEVRRLVEGGRVLERLTVTADVPTACMLGGADRRTMYVTTSIVAGPEELANARRSRVEITRVDVPGAGWPA